jgi:hypothetical protein
MSDGNNRIFLALQRLQATLSQRDEMRAKNHLALSKIFLHDIAHIFQNMRRDLYPRGFNVLYDRGGDSITAHVRIVIPDNNKPLDTIGLDLEGVASPEEYFIRLKRNNVRVWSNLDDKSSLQQKLEDLVLALIEEKISQPA